MMLTVLLADVIILVMMNCGHHNLAYDLILICSCKALLDSRFRLQSGLNSNTSSALRLSVLNAPIRPDMTCCLSQILT